MKQHGSNYEPRFFFLIVSFFFVIVLIVFLSIANKILPYSVFYIMTSLQHQCVQTRSCNVSCCLSEPLSTFQPTNRELPGKRRFPKKAREKKKTLWPETPHFRTISREGKIRRQRLGWQSGSEFLSCLRQRHEENIFNSPPPPGSQCYLNQVYTGRDVTGFVLFLFSKKFLFIFILKDPFPCQVSIYI